MSTAKEISADDIAAVLNVRPAPHFLILRSRTKNTSVGGRHVWLYWFQRELGSTQRLVMAQPEAVMHSRSPEDQRQIQLQPPGEAAANLVPAESQVHVAVTPTSRLSCKTLWSKSSKKE